MDQFPAVFRTDLNELDEQGIAFVGGHLSARWLLEAYRRGIFPWPYVEELDDQGQPVYVNLWCCPDPRWILSPATLHVPRRLQRRLRRGEFTFGVNRQFDECVKRCARRSHDGVGLPETWLSPELERGYHELADLGHALSFEVYQDGVLVGGILGVVVGGYFSAESMFHRVRDAGKAGLVTLVKELHRAGFLLIDIQQSSPHVCQMGGHDISRRDFLDRHRQAIAFSPSKTLLD